jgi:hypothetical protein
MFAVPPISDYSEDGKIPTVSHPCRSFLELRWYENICFWWQEEVTSTQQAISLSVTGVVPPTEISCPCTQS